MTRAERLKLAARERQLATCGPAVERPVRMFVVHALEEKTHNRAASLLAEASDPTSSYHLGDTPQGRRYLLSILVELTGHRFFVVCDFDTPNRRTILAKRRDFSKAVREFARLWPIYATDRFGTRSYRLWIEEWRPDK